MTDAATRPAVGATTASAPGALTVSAGLALGLITALLLRVRTSPDVDLWLHLRIGDLLNAGGNFGSPDPLAALADREYLPTQWLAQRSMAWIWSIGGMDGIQAVRLILVIALGAVVVAGCRVLAPPAASGLAAALTMFGAAAAWGERPQLAGLLLFAIVALLWWRAIAGGSVPLSVIPLTWLWACVHGTWTLGVAAGALLLAGSVLDRHLPRREAVRGVLVLLASVIAAALTPLGPQLLLQPFTVAHLATTYVNEWARPEASNPVFLVVLVAGGLAALGLFRSATRRWTRLACLLGGLVLALWMVRTIAFGAVLIAPVLAHALSTFRASDTPREAAEWPVWAVALTTVVAVGGWHIATTTFGPPISASLASALAQTSAAQPLAVDGHAVGWVQWAQRDRRPLYDLRAEVYSEPVTTAYRSFADAEPGWQSYAADQQIATLLLERDSPLDEAVAESGEWAVAAEDAGFRLWRSTSPAAESSS
jgi:hypothetical protein